MLKGTSKTQCPTNTVQRATVGCSTTTQLLQCVRHAKHAMPRPHMLSLAHMQPRQTLWCAHAMQVHLFFQLCCILFHTVKTGFEGSGLACTTCIPGYFKASASTLACGFCTSGTYASASQATECSTCSVCSTNALTNRTCMLAATADMTQCFCNAGYYGDGNLGVFSII